MHSRSKFLLRLAALVAAPAFIGAPAFAADAPAPTPIIDPNDIVADHTLVEWSESYLQWIASFPHGGSPISDTSGAQCAARQDGDVWFLAMSDGTAPVERACVVPAGKSLFVPVLSSVERSGNKEPDCPSMARIAADNLARASRLSMTLDGLAVDNLAGHRAATGDCFALGLRQVPRVATRTAVADGYYVMLKPLASGAHTIVVTARFDSVSLSTTYRLDVR